MSSASLAGIVLGAAQHGHVAIFATWYVIGSLITAALLSVFVVCRDDTEVTRLRAALKKSEADLERARRANLDAIALGVEMGREMDEPEIDRILNARNR